MSRAGVLLNLKALFIIAYKMWAKLIVKTTRSKFRHFLTLFLSFSLRLRNTTDKIKMGFKVHQSIPSKDYLSLKWMFFTVKKMRTKSNIKHI